MKKIIAIATIILATFTATAFAETFTGTMTIQKKVDVDRANRERDAINNAGGEIHITTNEEEGANKKQEEKERQEKESQEKESQEREKQEKEKQEKERVEKEQQKADSDKKAEAKKQKKAKKEKRKIESITGNVGGKILGKIFG